jgi:hypothetical protein
VPPLSLLLLLVQLLQVQLHPPVSQPLLLLLLLLAEEQHQPSSLLPHALLLLLLHPLLLLLLLLLDLALLPPLHLSCPQQLAAAAAVSLRESLFSCLTNPTVHLVGADADAQLRTLHVPTLRAQSLLKQQQMTLSSEY